MVVRTAKLVGAASTSGWPQVHIFSPGGEKKALGILVATVVVVGQEGMDLASFGAEAIQRLHETYYGGGAEKGLQRLKQAVEIVQRELAAVELSCACGVLLQRTGGEWVVYAVTLGGARVTLWREGVVVAVIKGENEIRGVSGFVKKGDRLCFSSEALSELLEGREEMEGVLGLSRVEEMVDQMAPVVHAQVSDRMGGVFVAMVEEEDTRELATTEEIEVTRMKTEEEELRVEQVGMFRRKVSEGARNVWERLTNNGRRERRANIYVGKTAGERKKKVVGSVAVVLGLLLVMSVAFGVVKQKTSSETREFREVQAQVDRLVGESKELEELNQLRARALLVEAKARLDEFGASGRLSRKAREWWERKQQEVETQLKESLRIYEVGEAGVFLDLNLVREETTGKQMDFDGKEVVVLSQESEVVLSVSIADKKSGVVGGGELLSGAELAAVYFGKGFVLSDKGVVELDLKRKTSAVVVEEDWGEIGAMDVFGGNLYLVDKDRGQIYRYRAVEGGFGSQQEWLGVGVEPDFSKVVSMAIDGDIWVLTQTGRIEKYSQGTGVGMEISGLDIPLSRPVAIYTDEELEEVFILDQGGGRVVVINKEGEYVAQYKWEGFKQATDVVVSKEEKKILVLVQSIIYEIPLKDK